MSGHRLDGAGALLTVPDTTASGRVVSRWELTGGKQADTRQGPVGWAIADLPRFRAVKGHLYWVVGSLCLRWADGHEQIVTVNRAGHDPLQKMHVGVIRTDSNRNSSTTYPTYISATFVADADADESINVVTLLDTGPWFTTTRAMYLYDDPGYGIRMRHAIYVIDMGPADAVVPSGSGKRLDGAGALAAVSRPSPVIVNNTRTTHVGPGGHELILKGSWTKQAGHQYLVLVVFVGLADERNGEVRTFWMWDGVANIAATRIGAYWEPMPTQYDHRSVAMVAVTEQASVEVYGMRDASSGHWLTSDSTHKMIVLDLGPK